MLKMFAESPVTKGSMKKKSIKLLVHNGFQKDKAHDKNTNKNSENVVCKTQ